MKKKHKLKLGIAVDSYKGSMTSLEAAHCIETGFKRAFPKVQTVIVPVADGGDGTARTIVDAMGGSMLKRRVHDPLGRPVTASFGLTADKRTAIIEMATASGLVLLDPKERNPAITTTRGTGELIVKALDSGARKILIGIGGSATNDGGTGMARALGARFLDSKGKELPEGGKALLDLEHIDISHLDSRLGKVSVDVACDVTNPLTGPTGAAAVYGPQKGATPAMVKMLDRALKKFASVVKRDLGISILKVPGGGAAGGLGAGLMVFAGGNLRPGVDMVMEAVRLKKRLKGCDLVITGEGCLDAQTVNGKTPEGVASVARDLGIPVIAIAGCTTLDVANVTKVGIDAFFSTQKVDMPADALAKKGPEALIECAEQVAKTLYIGQRL